jgi:hypothetical protein
MCRFLVAVSTLLPGAFLQAAEPTENLLLPGAARSDQNAAAPTGVNSPAKNAAAGPDDSATSVASLIRPKPSSLRFEGLTPTVSQLVEQLDDPSFSIRQQAVLGLEHLARQPEQALMLAPQLQQLAIDAGISYEVRTQLEDLLRRLPPCPPSPPQITAAEIERLLDLLDDDSFAAREGAARRLRWLAENPALVCPLLTALHQRLGDPALSAGGREVVGDIWAEIHGLWLLSDSATWNLPPVGKTRIADWIDDLATPARAGQEDNWPRHQVAQRELLDLLVRPDTAQPTIEALTTRLADPRLDPNDAERLQAVLEWTRPALVAEYWEGQRNLGIQHLLVGVPSLPAGAQSASHFDRVDDHVAHCVSGNSLSPGDYPVGVAFPHPRQPGAFFHLVNLPTTQRRLAYEFLVTEQGESQRLAEISRRTLSAILAAGRALDDEQITMLDQLDPASVSRFVGAYFLAVPDTTREETEGPFGALTRHGLVCMWLAQHGTSEALHGLVDAAVQHRFAEPDTQRPFRLPWVTALAIARRESGPDVDAWLAAQIQRTDILELGSNADVGATAASLLLARNGQAPREFGLAPVDSDALERLNLEPQRFLSAEDRAGAIRWSAELLRAAQ